MSAKKIREPLKTTVLEAVEDAASQIAELQQEMADWRDNMSNANMEHLPKYDQVSEAADALENADVESRAEALRTALEELAEGRALLAGCPAHVEGQPCKRCKWDGRANRLVEFPELVVYPFGEGPKSVWRNDDGTIRRVSVTVVAIRNISWTMLEGASEEEYKKELVQGRAYWWGQAADVERQNANRLGRRLTDISELAPFPGAEELAGKILTFTMSSKRRPSRADRLGEALVYLENALDAIDAFVDERKNDDAEDRLSDLEHAASELREACGELQGVEFPGMFG